MFFYLLRLLARHELAQPLFSIHLISSRGHASPPGIGCTLVGRLRYLDECPTDNCGKHNRGYASALL